MRSHLTYANVMATVSVFIALGGSSYAAAKIGSKQIADGSLQGKDIKNGSITGGDVRKKSLTSGLFKSGQLPRGATGATGPQGPQGTQGVAGVSGVNNITVRTEDSSASAGSSAAVYESVRCADGERAVSGGVSFKQSNGDPENATFNRMITFSRPMVRNGANDKPAPDGSTPTGWSTGALLTGGPSGVPVTYYAICVKP